MAKDEQKILQDVTTSDYKYGFVTDIETEFAPIGLSEDTVRYISAQKEEPEWLLEFRLKAYKKWLTMKTPNWAHLKIPPIDLQEIYFYAAPKKKKKETQKIMNLVFLNSFSFKAGLIKDQN